MFNNIISPCNIRSIIAFAFSYSLLAITGCAGSTDTEAVQQILSNNALNADETSNIVVNTATPELIEVDTFTYKTGLNDFIGPDYGSTVPAKGESRVDPVTGVRITRLTDANDFNGTNDSLIVYSRYSPENSNGKLFLVFGANSTSSWVVNRSTGAVVAELRYDTNSNHQVGEIHEVRWDTSGNHPNRVYFRNAMKFYQIDDVTKQDTTRSVIKDFDLVADIPAAASHLYNDVEGDSSLDGDHWTWMAAEYISGNYKVHAFVHYQISTDTTHVMKPSDLAGSPLAAFQTGSLFTSRPNMVEMNPAGTGVVIHYSRSYTGSPTSGMDGTWFDGPHLWPVNFDWATNTPVKISVDESHSGWGYDLSGQEMFISQNNRTDKLDAIATSGASAGYANRVQLADHADFGWSNGFHYGKMPASKPGWAFVNTYSNISSGTHLADKGADQLMLIQIKPETDTPIIIRVGSNYNVYAGDYRDEAPAAMNQAGDRIYVSTNWGGNLDHREVFIFELPSNWDTEVLTQ